MKRPLDKLEQPTASVPYNQDKFLEEFHALLVKYNAEFAVIWLKDGDNLISKGWSNSLEGGLICQAIERFLENHMMEILLEVMEHNQKKTEGLSDSLEAEFGT